MPEPTGRKSKTQLKREMNDLQSLGDTLVALPPGYLDQLPVPEKLLEAIVAARRMNKRGALHRQRQYIGRVMREINAEPILKALESLQERDRARKARLHQIEYWRDLIITDGDEGIEHFLTSCPRADRQQLRTLLRQHRKEFADKRPTRAARQLFRYIRDFVAL